MAEADRTYAMGLAALRQAAELTLVELARRMGVTQAAILNSRKVHDSRPWTTTVRELPTTPRTTGKLPSLSRVGRAAFPPGNTPD